MRARGSACTCVRALVRAQIHFGIWCLLVSGARIEFQDRKILHDASDAMS